MPQDETYFPPSTRNPLPVQAFDAPRSPTGDETWYPPSQSHPLPVTIVGSTPMFPEPPDNQLYGRRGPAGSGAWALIAATTGPPEAPNDGAIYGRGGTTPAWVAVLPRAGGTMTGALILAADPTSAMQATTKQYTDAQVGLAVKKAGDTMSGFLTLAADPTQPLQAATKQYVDNAITAIGGPYLPLAGGTISGSLVIGTPAGGPPSSGGLNLSGILAITHNAGGQTTDSFDTLLRLAGANNTIPEILLDGYGVGTSPAAFNLRFRFARGAASLPSAPQLNDPLGTIGFVGYATTGYVANAAARIVAVAAENWTGAANGSQLLFYTTPPGSTPTAGQPQLTVARGVVVGNAGGGDLGPGVLNAFGLAENGTAVALESDLNAYLQLAGGTMTGVLNLAADPTAVAQAATKRYVDAQVAGAPYLPRAGGVISGSPGSLVIGNPPGGSLGSGTLNMSGGLAVIQNPGATWDGSPIYVAGPDGALARITVANFAAAGGMNVTRANGTAGARTALQAGDVIGRYAFWGYGATGYSSANRANLAATALENWTDTAQGANLGFQTTAIGAATPLTRVTIAQGMIVGAPPDGDPGVGGLNMNAALTINMNAAVAPPVTQQVNMLRLVGADAANPRILIDALNAVPHYDLRRANGTGAAPAGINNGDLLGSIGWFGYAGGAGYQPSSRAGINALATETWSATGTGTLLNFSTTASGTGTAVTRMQIWQGLLLGNLPTTPPDGDLGQGTINMSGVLQVNANTVAAVPLAGSLIHLNGADAQSTRLTIDANGPAANPAIIFRRNYGTGAAPGAPVTGANLGALNFQGWVTGGFTQLAAGLNAIVSENWTPTANGTQLVFSTTAPGQPATSIMNRAWIGQGMWVGTPPDLDLGPGTINMSGVLQVNQNAASPPLYAGGWCMRAVAADGVVPRIMSDAFGNQSRFDLRRTDGTALAPTGVLNGEQMGSLGWFGALPGPPVVMSGVRASISGAAAETFSATNQGSILQFSTTPIGTAAMTNGTMVLDGSGNLTILGATATKPGGGSWTAPSSLAVKRNVEDYTRGLAELRHLQPISFEYNGEQGTIADGRRYVGVSAEAVAPLLPEMLSVETVRRYHSKGDDEVETVEHQTVMLDPTALTYALINAVYELDQAQATITQLQRELDQRLARLEYRA
jgi:hypothetical protein